MAPRSKKDPAAAPAEGTRRSTRLADKPAAPAPKPAPAKAPAAKKEKPAPKEKEESKKRAAEEKAEEPAAKKAKPAAEKAAKKPASKKPASKKAAAAKEETAAEADAEAAEEPGAEAAEEKAEVKEDGKAAEAEAAAEAPKEAAPETDGAGKELELGDVLPALTLKNQQDEEVDVKGLIAADKGVVFFLVPKANTPGCTKQACGFRDAYPTFTGLGYEVYCVSGDPAAAQAKWKTAQSLPYPLLSDPKHALIKLLGASAAGHKTKRSHFVFEKGSGKLILKSLGVKPDDSPKQVATFLEGHK